MNDFTTLLQILLYGVGATLMIDSHFDRPQIDGGQFRIGAICVMAGVWVSVGVILYSVLWRP